MSNSGDTVTDLNGRGDRIALDVDGNVYTWGYNSKGQCGRGFTGTGSGSALASKAQKLHIVGMVLLFMYIQKVMLSHQFL